MARKLLSVLGILAMLIAFLPGVIDASQSSNLPACCSGVLCPLHQLAAKQVLCDSTSRDGVLQPCPDQTTHYTGALPFVRVAPSILFSQGQVDSATPPAPRASAKISADVPYPPPRTA
jgi:hypothetical protein